MNYHLRTYIFRPDLKSDPLRNYPQFIVDGKGRPAIRKEKPKRVNLPERPTYLKPHQVEVPY